jgi:hypothetical protein
LAGDCARGLLAALLLGLWVLQGQAELGGDDYRPSGTISDEAERARVRAEIEAERRREAARAEQAARERAAEQARRQAALAAEAARKPVGERLVEAHCQTCHAPEVIAAVRHTRLGWHLTVLRMRTLHGARIPRQAVRTIVGHLSTVRGAGTDRAAIEYGLALTAIALPVAGALHLVARRRRATRSAGPTDAADRGAGPQS